MTAQLAPFPLFKGWDNNGNQLNGGQLFTYVAGTATPQATYVDSTQNTPNTNPVILNARGEANVWLDPTKTYKLVLQDLFGNFIWSQDQIVGGYVPVSQLAVYITQSFLGQQLYPQTPAEVTANATPVNFFYPPGYVDRYGTNTTPGTTSMLTAVTAAFNVAAVFGGSITFLPAQYFLGTYSGTGPAGGSVISLTTLDNTVIYGNGATIVVNTVGNSMNLLLYTIFNLANPSNITVINLNFQDTGADITQTWLGARAWAITNTASVDCGGLTFIGCEFLNIVAPIYVYYTPNFARVRQIHMAGCRGEGCYYGPVFADQGDAVTGDWWAHNPRRAYFAYGITGHDVSLNIFYDGTPNGGANGCIDLKRYQFDTRGLKIRAAFHGFAATGAGALVNFETQGNANALGISALGTITGGSSYTNGIYPGVALTGGTGTGALAQITVSGGAVTKVDVLNQGSGYLTTDTLSATAVSIGGTGSGFSVPVSAVGAFITDVEVDLSLSDYAYSPGVYSPIQFNSLQPNGTQNPTTTDVYDQISLRGTWGQWASLNTNPPINISSVPTAKLCHLAIESSLFRNFQSAPQVYPGFVIQTEPNKEVYTKLGDLTAAAVFIDLNKYDGRGWGLRVKIWAQQDASLGSANASMFEYSIAGHKPKASTPVIDSQVTVFSNPGSPSATPVFAASGTGINVSFSNFNNANSYLRMEVSHESAFL